MEKILKSLSELDFDNLYHEVIKFDNGYSASIVSGPGTYTNGPDEFEIAIITKDGLCYDTYLTDDVIENVKKEELPELLYRIKTLTPYISIKES